MSIKTLRPGSDIARIRLASQQLLGTKLSAPKELVAWMVAMQAQDYAMAKWAIGVRQLGLTEQDIHRAIDHAGIIRTHLLRPTWHFVAAQDVYWLLDLSAAQIRNAQKARDRQLELTEADYTKSNTIIEKALSDGIHLTREELLAELNQAKIATDQNRSSHLLARAELEKIICSGPSRNGKPTYALLSERVPKPKVLTKDEALAELARRYFISRCPATLQDFTWWSGLSVGEAREALDLMKTDFTPETIDGQTYWFTPDFIIPRSNLSSVILLPAYDEFIISYSVRSDSIPSELEQHMKHISNRGIFRPIIVVNGQVAGIWKRALGKEMLSIELQYFTQLDEQGRNMVEQACWQYGFFTGKKIQIKP